MVSMVEKKPQKDHLKIQFANAEDSAKLQKLVNEMK
jgi:hypothetical protein